MILNATTSNFMIRINNFPLQMSHVIISKRFLTFFNDFICLSSSIIQKLATDNLVIIHKRKTWYVVWSSKISGWLSFFIYLFIYFLRYSQAREINPFISICFATLQLLISVSLLSNFNELLCNPILMIFQFVRTRSSLRGFRWNLKFKSLDWLSLNQSMKLHS